MMVDVREVWGRGGFLSTTPKTDCPLVLQDDILRGLMSPSPPAKPHQVVLTSPFLLVMEE